MMTKHADLEKLRGESDLPSTAPNCIKTMKPEFVEYIEGESATLVYPVLDIYSNPRKSMQGGFICAAFDNVFGVLVSYATGRSEMASVDLCVNYHRPVFENDKLTVTAYLKSKGKTIVHLTGEAYDSKKRLVATATTNIMLLEKDDYHQRPKA